MKALILTSFGPGIDDSVDLSRYSPELDSHGQYSLPASGKYELRVLQTRNDARKNKTKNITSIFKLSKCQPTGTLPVINVNAPLLSVAQEVNDE